ncbi:hypothetical protein EV702DRAFT_1273147 [Suillus placidus]|uniref:Uncharacterized protein n=1 Tax=Suillus placidus TaxID=48579 RepID=A0A9P7CVK0_9AGAM|nr:hypothetical protein EV702DRAFT_1273147 [Suillus placidus]
MIRVSTFLLLALSGITYDRVKIATSHKKSSASVSVLQSLFVLQKAGQTPVPASVGIADIDDAKAATTARTIAEETRIVCEDEIK